MEFRVNDVVRHRDGGPTYRIHAITDTGYKATCLDNRLRRDSIVVLPFSIDQKYIIVEPPENEFLFYPGQVLLKKQGTPRIGLITSIEPGVDRAHNRYEIVSFDPQGKHIGTSSMDQKDLRVAYEIRNLKWIVLYGDPRAIVRKSLEKDRDELQKRVEQIEEMLDNLTYFEAELKNEQEEKEA